MSKPTSSWTALVGTLLFLGMQFVVFAAILQIQYLPGEPDIAIRPNQATATPTDTPTPDPFVTPEATPTPVPPTATSTNTPTPIPATTTPSPTDTPTPSRTPTAQPTATAIAENTNTPAATSTPKPTATQKPVVATAIPTSVPTQVPTAVQFPTNTPTPEPSPTAASTDTPVPTPTVTETSTPTETPSPTVTHPPTSTHTPLPTATATPTHTPTLTATPIPTPTPRTRNRAPEIDVSPGGPYVYSRGEEAVWLLSIVDQDGDPLDVSITPESGYTILQELKTRFQWLIQISLNTQQTRGAYEIMITAHDGFDETIRREGYWIGDIIEIPTPTATSTVTPTATHTATIPQPSSTATPTQTPTSTNTATHTSTATISYTPTRPPTPTATHTPTATRTPLPTPIPTRIPRATLTPSSTPTMTPEPTVVAGFGPTLQKIPDVRALINSFEENVLDLNEYVTDPDTRIEALQWSLDSSLQDTRVFLDEANRLSVGPSANACTRTITLRVSDGIRTASQTIRIKRSSFMLDTQFVQRPVVLQPGERWTSAHSLLDAIRPADFARERIALSIQRPLPAGIANAGITTDGRYWVEADDSISSKQNWIAIIARAIESQPTQTPQPTAIPTATPQIRPTPAADLVFASCNDEIAFALDASIASGDSPIDIAIHPDPPPGETVLLVSNYGESYASLIVINHAGHSVQTRLAAGRDVLNAVWGDWNNDGVYDIAILAGYDSTITIYWGIDAKTFREGPFWQLPALVEIPEERQSQSRLRLITSHRVRTWSTPWLVAAQPNELVAYAFSGNQFVLAHRQSISHDVLQLDSAVLSPSGDESLIVSRSDPNGFDINTFMNGRWIVSEQVSTEATFAGNIPQAMSLYDIDRDSIDDVALVAFNRELFFRMSQPPHERVYSEPLGMIVNDLALADWNNDGRTDLLLAGFQITSQRAALTLLCADEQGTFSSHATFPIPQRFPVGQQFTIAPLDYDGNAFLDLVMLDRSTNQISLFRNLMPSPNPTPAP